MEYHVDWLLKDLCFERFGDGKYSYFLSRKADEKLIFTDYWKVLVLNFLEKGNTVFFWANILMERWYLLCVFELLMIFQELGNMVFRELYHTNQKFYVTFLSLFCRFCCKNENTKKFFLLQSMSWSLKKLVFGSRGWRKYNIDF